MDVVLGIPFLTLKIADIKFAEGDLTWRTYTATDALPISKKIQIINQKKFAKVALDPNQEAFVVYVATLSSEMAIHLSRLAQIALLKAEEAPVTVPAEYSDSIDVFSEKLAAVLPEHTEINTYAIELEEGKQPLYRLIYSLDPVELEILKTYIETHLKTGFIQPSKSLIGTLILFNKKPDGSLHLCIDYWVLNNPTIKNRYPLLFIGKSLDWLGQAKRFIQLDLTSVYHQMRIKKGDE